MAALQYSSPPDYDRLYTLGSHARLAFIFLASKGFLPTENLWRAFFEGVPDHMYTYRVHTAPGVRMVNTSFLAGYEVRKPIITRYRHRSVVEAMLLTMAAALNAHPPATHFIIVSETCAPIRPFPFIYNHLAINFANFSFIDNFAPYEQDHLSLRPNKYDWKSRFLGRMENVSEWRFKKGAQYSILQRHHVQHLLKKDNIHDRFLRIFMLIYGVSPTEHAIQNYFEVFQPEDGLIYPDTLTYSQWFWNVSSKSNQHPRTFRNTVEEFRLMRSLADVERNCTRTLCYLFGRKWAGFTPELPASEVRALLDSQVPTEADAGELDLRIPRYRQVIPRAMRELWHISNDRDR
jgi:hypothetical protein